ncbi:presequence protease, mitochondrial-like [Drosophila innubila]|uniref:presequence protease, mitochondrial-like n=1 Tax=Drosophila innubila TaxID=198719 RepID=UPI00148E25C9|nr:presequence protease, mitochondrial-like [Drosophila innubila]
MLKRLPNLKVVQHPFKKRILHVQSPFQNSKSVPIQKVVNNAKLEPETELRRNVPYVIEDQNYRYKEGKIYHGFQCERIESIPDYGLMSCTLRHLGTGTEFWYLDRNDVHNVFSINFRTTPFDSTGLPHILEHITLCGSKNYPVRDPFFKMLNRSVATFMNAMTGPDYTLYPFSSMNEVDFRNLQKIYLDAVFRPNLLHLDFLQEGWRLEHEDLHNRDSDIVFKGVVYNEMIGALSDNARLFKHKMVNHILPSHTYGHIAAGDPLEIPKLTHKDLVEFHRKYYHPSNARIFCYGSFDLEKTLAFVDKEYLSHYEFIDNAYSYVSPHERWSEPRIVHVPTRLDCMGASIDRQNQIAIGLLTCDITDIQECFELKVLSELMIRGPNSAFYKSLIEPNFSGGYITGAGFTPNCKDTFFFVGLRDLRIDDFERFNDLYDQTVHKASQEGFESEHIESVLCNLELSLKHENEMFGKHLLYKTAIPWNHGGDVVSCLRDSNMLATLRGRLKENSNYFQQKIEKYFLDNTHKLTLTMSPDEMCEIKRKLSEAKLLLQKLNEISDEEYDNIYENGIKLEVAQKSPENIEVLPCLSINDVKDPIKCPQMEETTVQNVPTQFCKVSSNGITYFNCFFNITGLSQDDAMLVPLFCHVISEMGTSNHDFREFDRLRLTKMATFTCDTKVVENVLDGKSYRLGLIMTTHALDKNVSDMFELCEELMLNFKFENTSRLSMLIENYISKLSLKIGSSGHLFAMLNSSGLVTNAAKLKSQLAGVCHIDLMKEYVQQNSIEDIQDRLRNIGAMVFSKNNLRVAINSSAAHQATVLEHYERFLNKLPTLEKSIDNTELHLLEPSTRHFIMNKPLSYCAKSFSAVPYVHEDHPVLRVLAKFLTAKYLLPVVREQNGAYGAGARIGFDGLFSFYSYRDPHARNTIEVFDKTYEWLQSESYKLDQQALFEAKLGVLQLLDWPTGPGDIGMDNFVLGASYDIYSRYRSRVLNVTVDDVRAVIEKYFKEEPKHFGKCILGPEIEENETSEGVEITS